MRFDIITIFPDMFSPIVNASMLKRAQAKKRIAIHIHDLNFNSSLILIILLFKHFNFIFNLIDQIIQIIIFIFLKHPLDFWFHLGILVWLRYFTQLFLWFFIFFNFSWLNSNLRHNLGFLFSKIYYFWNNLIILLFKFFLCLLTIIIIDNILNWSRSPLLHIYTCFFFQKFQFFY